MFLSQKQTLFIKLKQIFVLPFGNTADLVFIKVVKYYEVASGKLEILRKIPDSDYAQNMLNKSQILANLNLFFAHDSVFR